MAKLAERGKRPGEGCGAAGKQGPFVGCVGGRHSLRALSMLYDRTEATFKNIENLNRGFTRLRGVVFEKTVALEGRISDTLQGAEWTAGRKSSALFPFFIWLDRHALGVSSQSSHVQCSSCSYP